MDALPVEFTATLEQSPAKGGTRGLVKVRGTVDGRPFRSSFKEAGNRVRIRLDERL